MIEAHGQLPILAKEKSIEALEKQIPKKVITERNIYLCPTAEIMPKQIVVMICLIID